MLFCLPDFASKGLEVLAAALLGLDCLEHNALAAALPDLLQ